MAVIGRDLKDRSVPTLITLPADKSTAGSGCPGHLQGRGSLGCRKGGGRRRCERALPPGAGRRRSRPPDGAAGPVHASRAPRAVPVPAGFGVAAGRRSFPGAPRATAGKRSPGAGVGGAVPGAATGQRRGAAGAELRRCGPGPASAPAPLRK